MSSSNSRKKLLEDILNSGNFDRLLPLADEREWIEMTSEERELLGLLFVMQGEKQLTDGNDKVLESFKLANQVAPNSPEVMYQQAAAFAKQTHNIYCLKAANHIFEKVTEMKPDFFEAWRSWGNTWVLLGVHSQEEQDLQTALSKFIRAEEVSAEVSKQTMSYFYRDFGVLWYHIGKFSGEAFDFRNALKMYYKGVNLGLNSADLWNGLGSCLVEISVLLNKPELIVDAVEVYWKAVRLKPDYFDGWFNFSWSLKALYDLHPQEAYFTLANEGFEQAARLNPQSEAVWTNWGQLLFARGKLLRDIESLKESCQKFEVADGCENNFPPVLNGWGESLLLIGEWTDDLAALKKAEEKIIKSLEIQPDKPSIWRLYGTCLTELARYFDDQDYYLEAEENLKKGLSHFPKDHTLWYGLAMTLFSHAQLRNDPVLLQEAANHCQKAIENGGHSIPRYWNDWGMIFMKLGTMKDERESIDAALNRFEQALRLKSNQLKNDALDPEWLYNYGCALDYLGDIDEDASCFEKAIEVLKKVISIDPTFHYPYFNLAMAYIHLAEISADLECYSQAFKYLEGYLLLQPEDEYAWNEWGVALIDLAHFIQDPSVPEQFRKCLLEAEGKFIQARSLGSASAVYHLACLYSLLGNNKVALHFLERAKEIKAIPPVDDLLKDSWLEGVRQTPEFKKFLTLLEEGI